ncbi:MAG: ParB/RepB/Spo0J family partition protein, partial [Deltaproteobacteria bacterium]|nr:ParB/RepB/Spo0J family partition protein [Deltaproteobacteria bacterium]
MAPTLASLVPDSVFNPDRNGASGSLRRVPVEAIRPNPEQPRRTFDPSELQGLVDSIRENGLLSPLLVREEEGKYYLIAGERRLRAAARAGLSEVPVILREAAHPSQQLELALVENLQRTDLDPVEAAQGYARLVRVFGHTQAEVAKRVGRDRSTVANAIRLLDLPGFALDALKQGHITA